MKTKTILIICHSNLLRMRNVSDKSSRENQNTYFMISNFFFSSENCAIYGIMWKNAVQLARPQTVWYAYTASWITKATNTWSEYVILNAFPLQQLLHESASMLCYTYNACPI
jgi:hypothetical protein